MKVFIQLTVEIESHQEPPPPKDEMAASALQAVVLALTGAEMEGFTHRFEGSTTIFVDPDDIRVLSTDPEETCVECGSVYPADAVEMTGPWHQKSCSLHPKNIVPGPPKILNTEPDPQDALHEQLIEDMNLAPAPKVIKLPCYGIAVTLGLPDPARPGAHLGGSITTQGIHINKANEKSDEYYNSAIDALESFILAAANAGVDITTPAFIEAIETAVEAANANV